MGTGLRGAFILTWAQTRVEGEAVNDNNDLAEGMSWSWHGHAFALEGADAALILTASRDLDHLRAKAARAVRKILQQPAPFAFEDGPDREALPRGGFMVSDGTRFYVGLPLALSDMRKSVILFPEGLPPPNRSLTVVAVDGDWDSLGAAGADQGAVMCFAPDVRLRGMRGDIIAGALAAGDILLTRDNGLREVLWVGRREISPARLYAEPELRPIRLPQNLFGQGQPHPDLLVSPDHRILIQTPQARALWGEDEVLLRAADLVGPQGARVDHSPRGVTYIHILMAQHEVVYANGIAVDSFLPDPAQSLPPDMTPVLPDTAMPWHSPPARRLLTAAEAAILTAHLPRGAGLYGLATQAQSFR